MRFDLHYLLSAKHAQWIVIALISLFSVLIITEFATLRFSSVSIPASSETAKNMLPKNQTDAFESILKSSLFGVYVSNDMNASSVKQSLLNVTLVGILFADKIENSQVIIRGSNGEEKTYKLGDKISGDAVIKRITTDGVLVERQGALESLSLPKNELIFEPLPKPLKEE